MGLRSTNLNLLPILRALLTEGSVTSAASVLGLSQPATSNALSRLRHLLGDPLLVQVGRTMQLTPRARRLRPMLDSACSAIETILLDAEFDPRSTKRSFSIATPDYVALLIGPYLMRLCQNVAPGVSVRFAGVTPDINGDLASGRIDLAIAMHSELVVRGLCVQSGYMDSLVCVMSAVHPLADALPLDSATLAKWSKLGIATEHKVWSDPFHVAANDERFPVTLSASHMLLLPLLAAETEDIAIVPRMLALQAAKMVPLSYCILPEPSPPLDVCLAWSPMLDADPAHRWFRQAVDDGMQQYFTSANAAPDVDASTAA